MTGGTRGGRAPVRSVAAMMNDDDRTTALRPPTGLDPGREPPSDVRRRATTGPASAASAATAPRTADATNARDGDDATRPIQLDDVSLRLGRTTVLDGIDLTVRPGEIVGLVGPNGAGKSTLVSLVAGLRAPGSGTVRVLGLDPLRHAAVLHRRVGVQLQDAVFHDALTVREILRVQLAFHDDPFDLDELLAFAGLDDVAGRCASALSGGQHQRLALAVVAAGRPELLVLDELTSGLDPASRETVRERIRAVRDAGATVLLVSHDLDDVASLCDRIVLLQDGRIAADASPDRFVADHRLRDRRVRSLSDAFLAATRGPRDGRDAGDRRGSRTEAGR